MHELSIAMSILEMAGEEAAAHGRSRVEAVHLKLGRLAGVVKEALLYSYQVAAEGTNLEGSRLVIEDVPIIVNCVHCRSPQTVESIQWFVCPQCNNPVSEVIQGREVEVFALELEDTEVS